MKSGILNPQGYLDLHRDIRFRDSSGLTTFPGHGFVAPDEIFTPTSWKLPDRDGAPGSALITNGGGVLSWSPSGSASKFSMQFDNADLEAGILTVEHGLPSPVTVQIWDNDNWMILPDNVRMIDTEAGIIQVELTSFLTAGILPGDPNSWSVVVTG